MFLLALKRVIVRETQRTSGKKNMLENIRAKKPQKWKCIVYDSFFKLVVLC